MLKSLLNKKNNKGFTLVELIVVIAIMAILAVAVTPKLTHFLENSKVATDKEIINTICTAYTTASLDAELYDTMPSYGGSGVELTAARTGTPVNKLYLVRNGNKFTVTADSGIDKFEAAVQGILPTSFELKSKTWGVSTSKITVTVSGQGEVKVVLSNGLTGTSEITYIAEKN